MSKKLTEELKIKIKTEFVEGVINENNIRQYPTIEALSKTYDIPRATIYRHSQKEEWQIAKNRFQTKLEQRISDARMKDMVAESRRLDTNSLQIAQALLGTIAQKMTKARDREQNEPEYDGLKPHELREMSTVAMNAQRIGKLALGEAQEISKVSANVVNTDEFEEVLRYLDEFAKSKSSKGNHIYQ
jgi:hypothetical protein|tara:strand:+ start:7898 stop:8458 length:561 start_codon:yes stop_codon:yes gene_type:complete